MEFLERLSMFGASTLPATVLCFGILYQIGLKWILKTKLSWPSIILAFLLAWVLAALPGYFFGLSAYDGFRILLFTGLASAASLLLCYFIIRSARHQE